jgi:hypothetical protein
MMLLDVALDSQKKPNNLMFNLLIKFNVSSKKRVILQELIALPGRLKPDGSGYRPVIKACVV